MYGRVLCWSEQVQGALQLSVVRAFPSCGATAPTLRWAIKKLTATLRAVVERFGLQGQRLMDDVARARVMKHSSRAADTRVVLGSAGRGNARPRSAACLRHQSRSGDFARQQDSAGPDRVRIAAGVDTVSDPPVVYPKSFQQLLLRSYRASPR